MVSSIYYINLAYGKYIQRELDCLICTFYSALCKTEKRENNRLNVVVVVFCVLIVSGNVEYEIIRKYSILIM